MNALVISTSQSQCGVAYAAPSTFELRLLPSKNTGEHIRDVVAGFAQLPIERVIVDTGPGSFTGSRIGIAFAQGFARGKSVPWVGITVWETLAQLAQPGETPITATRSNEVWYLDQAGANVRCPLAEVILPFGFPMANPDDYGGSNFVQGRAPELREYLQALYIAGSHHSAQAALSRYDDKFATHRERR